MPDIRTAAVPDSRLLLPSGGGAMGELLHALDWDATALGPPGGWPPSLRAAAGIVLAAPCPMYLAWGPDLAFLFNDAYRRIMGARGEEPARYLGRPYREVWPDLWEEVKPKLDAVLGGAALQAEDSPLVVHRNGYAEQVWVSYSLSPVRTEDGAVGGVLCVCAETTAQVRARAERDAALHELEASNEQLRIAADAAELGLFDHDLQTDAVHWNERVKEHFGLPPDAAIVSGMFARAFHPDDRARIQAETAAFMAAPPADGKYRSEYRTIGLSDGRERWIVARGRLFLDAAGRPARLIGTTTEVTRRRRAEEEARATARDALAAAEANAKFRTFFDQGAHYAALLAPDGRVREVNRAALGGGYRREDMLGRPLWECGWWAGSDDLGATVRAGAACAARGDIFRRTLPCRTPDGAERLVDTVLAPVHGDDGRILFIAVTGIDITERRRVEERLRLLDLIGEATRAAAEPEAIMEQATRLLGEYLGATRVAYADMEADNDRFTIRHDWTVAGAASTVGVYSLDLFGSRATSHLRVGRTLLIDDVDRELAAGDGAEMFNAIGIKAIICCPLVRQGRMAAMMAVHQDRPRAWSLDEVALVEAMVERCWAHIERVRSTEALREADRRKSEFLATLAHELRNPLAPIRNGLEVLRLAEGKPQMQASVRAMMERQLSHMVHLIDDLLDIARVSSGKVVLKIEPVTLQGVVAAAVETSLPLIEAAGHALSVQVPEAPLLLDADPVRLSQVLGNLLSNAAKYTPRGGSIVVSACVRDGEAEVSVADSGIGIAAESLASVFDMFTQVARSIDRSRGGLGIGLALVRHLVELHGGTVSAASAGPGQGSRFTVRLPLGGAAQVVDAVPPAAAALPARPLRVLVADDNVDAAQTLCALLRLAGYEVCMAHDGAAAVELAAVFRPELAFLDIGMPRMDGYQAARAIRALPELEHAHLVALTGWGAAEDRSRSRAAGFDAHLLKPAAPEQVWAILDGMAAQG